MPKRPPLAGPRRRLAEGLLLLVLSALLLVAVELTTRGWRALQGEETTTRVERLHRRTVDRARLYRRHPFLNTGPRPGGRIEASGKVATFNSGGYRSPERPVRPRGDAYRILCAGGSSTFDVAAADDASSWPWRLETLLVAGGRDVEVWNAGFPGWTSLESLISFAQRDLELDPDLLVLYQGINDLQPGGHRPFDPGYEGGHAAAARRALGLELGPLRWTDRSVLLEAVRDRLRGPEDPWDRLRAETPPGGRLDRLPDAAVATFRRNVRSLLGVARAHDVAVLLVTQPLRLRERRRPHDLEYLGGWLSGLDPAVAPRELERLNDGLRALAAEERVPLWDAARLPWRDGHFADPMHFSPEGSARFATALARRLAPSIPMEPAEGEAPRPRMER